MTGVTVSIEIDAPVDRVWAELEDVASHVEWMADAESLTFTSERTSGVGTVAEVRTVIGPLRTTDVMRFTEWVPERTMAIDHEGLVAGTGRFVLDDIGPGRTRMTWSEHLVFPARFGGRLGATVARPVFRRVWTANLKRLKARIEA